MNEVSLSGWLTGKPAQIGEGENRGVRFLIRAMNKFRRDGKPVEVGTTVSCVVFKCPDELQELLLSGKKLWLEGAGGRVAASSYETTEGRQFSMNVVFDAVALTVLEQ